MYDIAAEFMRWEIATAVAGAVIGINPFDQPNVQESKDITKKYVAEVEAKGALAPESPTISVGGSFDIPASERSVDGALGDFLVQVKPGDYVCLQAYLGKERQRT